MSLDNHKKLNEIMDEFYLVDLDKVILEFNAKVLLELFGEQWHKSLLGENTSKREKIELFLTKIFNTKDQVHIDRLVNVLLHTGQDQAAFRINENVIDLTGQDQAAFRINENVIDLIDLSRCDPRNGHVDYFSFGEANPKNSIFIEDGRSSDGKSNALLVKGGLCFLLNNYFTKGTYKEMQRFRNIFDQLNFDVIMRKNLSAKDITKELLLLSKSEKLKGERSEIAFVFLSISHGNSNGELIGFDGNTVKTEKIVDLFNIKNCPDLEGPRIFFFNCCRGSNSDDGLSQSFGNNSFNIVQESSIRTSLPSITPQLYICYSTLQGYLAEVDWNTGTRFGNALADSFVERAKYKDLNALIDLAKSKLEKLENDKSVAKQPIEVINRATRQLFFNLKPKPNLNKPHI